MEVVVEDKQLSLAIGKKGQNVRLAAKLTGWRIDIKSEEEKRREVEAEFGALELGAADEGGGEAAIDEGVEVAAVDTADASSDEVPTTGEAEEAADATGDASGTNA
jgi:N utilization substance protein A